jgi:hypothetical protein
MVYIVDFPLHWLQMAPAVGYAATLDGREQLSPLAMNGFHEDF